MELLDFVGLAAIPYIVGLVELVKPFVADKRLYPLIAVAFGITLNEVLAWQLGNGYALATLLGVATGLAASGLYSAGATVRSGNGGNTP